MQEIGLPAILGGKPLFDKPYHLVRPILPDFGDVLKGLETLYESRMLTNQGKYVVELEKIISEYLGVKHCALFCNGTVAIMCLLRAMDIKGEVIVPSFTFAATTQALLWQGLVPKFVDIEPGAFTLDPAKIEQAINKNTTAIFPVNLFGGCCNHDKISEIANEHSLSLIYDSAQAFGTKYKGKFVGALGVAEVLSFHATKIFHTGEGGAVVTSNTDLYKKLCRIRNFGFEGYLNCTDIGINGKMSEFSAIIGINLIGKLPSHIEKRKWVFSKYKESLCGIDGITIPDPSPDVEFNYSTFFVLIDPKKFGLSNVELYYALMLDNIVTRCYFYPPVHRTSYYQKLFSNYLPELPVTDWAATSVLCLPLYSDMEENEFERIVHGIKRCRENSSAVKKELEGKIPTSWQSLQTTTFSDPHDKFILKRQGH